MAVQNQRREEFHIEERDLWLKLPHLHKWWNKLYLAEVMGYSCGPGGTSIPETREYVIRPTYNLAGMGICTTIKTLEKGDITSVPPGYFWCEYLEGRHFSASYEKVNGEWKCLHNWQGWNDKFNVVKFRKWIKQDFVPKLPKVIADIDVPFINVEFKEDKPIEIHFRPSGNPDGTYEDKWNEHIPVWEDTPKSTKNELYNQGYTFINNPFDDWMDDLEPYMNEIRLGYFVK